ncbi:hypothetical protein KUTeg_002313 [Tegillarca granosa]|uniref:alkaline phosphatase n=1 Tax=Tegillarca granosa TaxID=220873 RepID=A0ABQ9FX69_TEGGR|nr:hypothetical protein KUTeg_002313 [Tegillarca granosa]
MLGFKNRLTFLLFYFGNIATVLTGTTKDGLYSTEYSGNGETPLYWKKQAKDSLRVALSSTMNIGVAKNVILFIGDGMGVSTVTAARILQGQRRNKTGEENILSFEKFPHVAFSKIYSQDYQTPDSACTATAMLCGVKSNYGTLGVTGNVKRSDCEGSKGNELSSIFKWSKDKGKSTGIVTTTRITHATIAAGYSNSADRGWENDANMVNVKGGCKDIAKQLIEDNKDIQVLLGGGRRNFLPFDAEDPEGYNLYRTGRRDNRNLIDDWVDDKVKKNKTHRYVWNSTDFYQVNADKTDYLLGLFEGSHMQFEADRLTTREKAGEPSLAEMTTKAIEILRKNNKNGYFLLVEGGRIDHAHHDSMAHKSLVDTLAFADAVAIARDGYPYTTLMYANGPGAPVYEERRNLTGSAVPLYSETHSGEDVPIYARGPMSHLFQGVKEQNYIAHVMAYASCVGDYKNREDCAASLSNIENTHHSCPKNSKNSRRKLADLFDRNSRFTGNGETPFYWRKQAKDEIHKILNAEPNIGPAKNVILFLGDGMGVSTVTAARILQGQNKGQTGEENILSWEKFPYTALSKTYNQDYQTADSAGTATAFLCGVKANYGTTGVDASTKRYDCESSKGAEVSSILRWSMDKGKSTGIVTTARVTHATPASGYSSSANRNWEGDSDMVNVTGGCKDIARQLIEDNPDIQVILGGGRRYFLPFDAKDPEGYNLWFTGRRDNRSLVQEWLDEKNERNKRHRYVWNSSDFYSVNAAETDYLLGLFQPSHMQYEIERLTSKEKGGEPSLSEMTEKAIDILSRNTNGYFLLVEGSGRIDHGHHDNKPKRALTDTLAFADAVAKADEITNEQDTICR